MRRRDFLTGMAAGLALPAGIVEALARPSGRRAPRRRDAGLEAVVLGTVQDGGLPQAGCYTERCERGRELVRSGTPRYVTSLALVQPGAGRFHLVDVTPDVTRQIDLITHPGFRERAAARDPFDGVFLTHGHIGHYLGLGLLGNEGVGVRDVPAWGTARMARFLRRNGPWSLMVEQGRIVPTPLEPAPAGVPVSAEEGWHRVDAGLDVKLLPVPHRDEFTDTVAFVFRGAGGSLLYLPDIDAWDAWDRDVAEVVAEVDAALLDGTFHSAGEVPGRSEAEIPHPLIPRTMDRLQGVVDARRARVVFTHLNNSNAALDDDSPERREIERRGFEVAREGMRFAL